MEMSYSYVLQPRRPGKLRIGSATIQGVVDRVKRSFRTQPLEITVLEQKPGKKGGGAPDYFVQASLDVQEAYLGQQVILEYTLFTTVEVQNFNMVEESQYLDFYAEDLSGVDPRVNREIFNGREYYSQVLKRLALYPQKVGSLTIQPASMQLGIVTEADAGSFFFGGDVKRVGVSTEPLTLRVKPLPPGAPVSFSGAVGTFSFEASLDRNTATTDDALSLVLTITGDGDLKRVEAPVFTGLDSFDMYDPRVKEEIYGEEAGKRAGRKVFEYLLAPKVAGKFTLVPSFSYFSPESGKYVTLTAQTFKIDIQQGKGEGVQGIADQLGDTDGLMDAQELSRVKKRLVERPLFWMLLLVPLLGFGIAQGADYFQRVSFRSQGSNSVGEAHEIAEKYLRSAATYLQKGDSRQFYQAVSNAFLQYVSVRTGLPLSEQSEARILEELAQRGLENGEVESFSRILKNCELALYAGMDNSAAMEETYRKAVDMLGKLEQFFRKANTALPGK